MVIRWYSVFLMVRLWESGFMTHGRTGWFQSFSNRPYWRDEADNIINPVEIFMSHHCVMAWMIFFSTIIRFVCFTWDQINEELSLTHLITYLIESHIHCFVFCFFSQWGWRCLSQWTFLFLLVLEVFDGQALQMWGFVNFVIALQDWLIHMMLQHCAALDIQCGVGHCSLNYEVFQGYADIQLLKTYCARWFIILIHWSRKHNCENVSPCHLLCFQQRYWDVSLYNWGDKWWNNIFAMLVWIVVLWCCWALRSWWSQCPRNSKNVFQQYARPCF